MGVDILCYFGDGNGGSRGGTPVTNTAGKSDECANNVTHASTIMAALSETHVRDGTTRPPRAIETLVGPRVGSVILAAADAEARQRLKEADTAARSRAAPRRLAQSLM